MSLTVIVPVWKREIHALRLLWHLDRTAFPYPVTVADGGDNALLGKLLGDETTVPRLRPTYRKYAPDASLVDLSHKMADATSKAQTPYVTIVNEDDFCLPSGIERCVDFLNANRDYACCGGRVATFVIDPNPKSSILNLVVGNFFDPSLPSEHSMADLPQETSRSRVTNHLARYAYTYIAIHRREILAQSFEETARGGIDDPQLWELYLSVCCLAHGKAKAETSTVQYLKQLGASSYSANQKDFLYRIQLESWHETYRRFAHGLAKIISTADGIAEDGMLEELRDSYATHLRRVMSGSQPSAPDRLGPAQFVKHRLRPALAGMAPSALRRAVRTAERHRKVRELRDSRRAAVEALGAQGADQAGLDILNAEFDAIGETLTGRGFADFLRDKVPDCLALGGDPKVRDSGP